MPEIDSETIEAVTPRKFLKRVNDLWKSQRRELVKILGNPPDFSKVRQADWSRWQKEQEAVLLILMSGFAYSYMQQSVRDVVDQNPEIDWTEVDKATADKYYMKTVLQRSRWASGKITDTTKRRFSERSRRTAEQVDANLKASRIAEELLSGSRSEMVVRTEMSGAYTCATFAIANALRKKGLTVWLIWQLRPCEHCEVCPMLDGTTEEFWKKVSSGPPIHPSCCCRLRIFVGSKSKLQTSGLLKREPLIGDVRRAMAKHGFKTK